MRGLATPTNQLLHQLHRKYLHFAPRSGWASSLYMLLIIRVISLAQAVLSRCYTTSFTTVLFRWIWRCRKLQRLKTHSAIRHLMAIIIPPEEARMMRRRAESGDRETNGTRMNIYTYTTVYLSRVLYKQISRAYQRISFAISNARCTVV